MAAILRPVRCWEAEKGFGKTLFCFRNIFLILLRGQEYIHPALFGPSGISLVILHPFKEI